MRLFSSSLYLKVYLIYFSGLLLRGGDGLNKVWEEKRCLIFSMKSQSNIKSIKKSYKKLTLTPTIQTHYKYSPPPSSSLKQASASFNSEHIAINGDDQPDNKIDVKFTYLILSNTSSLLTTHSMSFLRTTEILRVVV